MARFKGATLPAWTVLLALTAMPLMLMTGCPSAGGGGGGDDEPQCVEEGGQCDATADCCDDLVCTDGTCQEEEPPPECAEAGEACMADGDCCEGLTCTDGTCQEPASECVEAGGACEADEDCCEGLSCTDGTCQEAEAVTVTTSMEGEAAPGVEYMITANVATADPTTEIISYSWEQSNSVQVELEGANTDTVTVIFPDAATFKEELFNNLAQPPITAEQLPPNVPVPDEVFPARLPNRFQVVGLNPFVLEETGLVHLTLTVETSAGTVTEEVAVHAELPWDWSLGIRNVPIDVPVLLYGEEQDTYDWELSRPTGSAAELMDEDTRAPYFTPDVEGLYRLTVTDMAVTDDEEADEEATIEIHAGTWVGAISGEGPDGLPEADSCTVCHDGGIAGDTFTPWRETGHAEIFKDQINFGDHYSESCLKCHTVGYNEMAVNDGIDDVDGWEEFLAEDPFHTTGPDIYANLLEDHPEVGARTNIQCENCHGPQGSDAHTEIEPRVSLSSDVCAFCHGEPLRHGRFQQWQLSGHANFDVAIDEGGRGSCARCHTANGFLAWLPVLLDDDPETDPLADVEVTWTSDEIQPQTCVVCHDPHSVGTVSGDATDATVRIYGDTPPLIAGFTAHGVGGGAICMTCHNSRRGIRDDSVFEDDILGTSETARAPHQSAQADVVMGYNAFFVETGVPGSHAYVEESCVACHMQNTPPPDVLSYNLGGTNHTFFAGDDICASCHGELQTAQTVHDMFEPKMEELLELIEDQLLALIEDVLADGNTINVADEVVLTDAADIDALEYGESHGRQAVGLTIDGEEYELHAVSDLIVLDGADEEIGMLYDFADERLIKSGWNYNLAHSDGSRGVHNPSFVFEFLDASLDAMHDLAGE